MLNAEGGARQKSLRTTGIERREIDQQIERERERERDRKKNKRRETDQQIKKKKKRNMLKYRKTLRY